MKKSLFSAISEDIRKVNNLLLINFWHDSKNTELQLEGIRAYSCSEIQRHSVLFACI